MSNCVEIGFPVLGVDHLEISTVSQIRCGIREGRGMGRVIHNCLKYSSECDLSTVTWHFIYNVMYNGRYSSIPT